METPRFIKDIERCPYLPKDPGYDEWMRIDQERIARINKEYARILQVAKICLVSGNPNIQQMCRFVIDMLEDK